MTMVLRSERRVLPPKPTISDKVCTYNRRKRTVLTLMWKKSMLATVMASDVRLLPVLQWNTKAWWLFVHESFVCRKLNKSCCMASNSCT